MVGIGIILGIAAKAKGYDWQDLAEGGVVFSLIMAVVGVFTVIAGMGLATLFPVLNKFISEFSKEMLIVLGVIGGFVVTFIEVFIGGAVWNIFEWGKEELNL